MSIPETTSAEAFWRYARGKCLFESYMALRGPAGMLHDLIVDPEHRGRGVGRLLLDAVLEFLRARGVLRVVLSTAERNEAAQRLFTSAAFRRTMIEMTRELEDPAEATDQVIHLSQYVVRQGNFCHTTGHGRDESLEVTKPLRGNISPDA
jgi:ribosomal protein S18 acetylase RimI-like enzyme